MTLTDEQRNNSGPCARFSEVRADSFAAGKMAAEYFLEKRFENFAFVGEIRRENWSEQLGQGFADRLAETGKNCFRYTAVTKNHNQWHFAETAPNGCVSATDSEEKVREWWGSEKFSQCNIGLLCENVLVIDVDNRVVTLVAPDSKDDNGDFARIIDRVGPLPNSPTSLSGNGGYHLLFQRPAADLKGTNGLVWDGQKTDIDIQVGAINTSLFRRRSTRIHNKPTNDTELN